ncbi:MAG: hypothetical protein KKA68_21260 [Gammaproteobacteria bacterium]|nr:hypothetical protein [Gammaproteobacteria bacterium]
MTPSEQMEQMKLEVVPRLQEFGISAFVIVGYLETEKGIERVCIANTAGNPAFEDGLRPIISFAHLWGASASSFSKGTNPDPIV